MFFSLYTICKLNLTKVGITRSPTIWYYHDTWVMIQFYHNVAICWELQYHTLQFFIFFNCILFSQSKTLSASSVSPNKKKLSVCSCHFNNFLLHFFISPPDSEHLAPSSGLKSQFIFYYSVTENVEFVFATFITNVCNKILILGLWIDIILRQQISQNYTVSIFIPNPESDDFDFFWRGALNCS